MLQSDTPGNKLQGAGNSFLILCPGSRIKLHLEVHHCLQQFHPGKGSFFHRCHGHTVQIIVVPGITLRHFRTLGSVGFMVQNRCLLPESPLRRNGQNSRILLCKDFRIIDCGIGLDPSDFCGRPSGQRTDLQTNNLQGSGICKQVRIGKGNCLFVLFVYVNIRLTAKLLRKFCLNGGTKLLRRKTSCPSIGFFVERILFGVGTFFPWLVLTVSSTANPESDHIFGKVG